VHLAVRGSVPRFAAIFAAGLIAACASGAPGGTVGPSPATSLDPARDLLAHVLERETVVLPVDPAYPPASFAVEGARRPAETKCAENQLTGAEVDGYDVATAKLVAEALGLEPCFVTPTWTQLLAGHWADRWDVAFSSIGITTSRMAQLLFTRPYYATPERFYVKPASGLTAIDGLDGRRIGVCASCFADLYLQKRLDIPGLALEYSVDNAVIVPFSVERSGLEEVGQGSLDAFLCQETAGDQAIAEGVDLVALEPAPYAAYPAGAIDKSSSYELRPFLDRVNEILGDRLGDGTLKRLSTQHFGKDYATLAQSFDLSVLEGTAR
jgi:ABC-type amino acid transport substrate-binding protein